MTEQPGDYTIQKDEDLEMSRQIIQEISGFYPLFEVLLDRYKDSITPAVFGVAWRYCQMPDGVCKASLRTIAAILNISEATVMRRLEILCEDGYLIDTTPDARNKPHIYVDAGKVIMKSALGVVETVSHRNSTKTVSHRKVTVSESQLIKDSIKENDDKDAKAIEERTALFTKLYSENVGAITSLTADIIRNMAIDYPDSTWYTPAFEIAVKNNARNLNYVDAVLRGWKDHFLGWKPEKVVKASNGSKPATDGPAPAVNTAAVEATKQYNDNRWSVPFSPPPANLQKPVLKQPERRARR